MAQCSLFSLTICIAVRGQLVLPLSLNQCGKSTPTTSGCNIVSKPLCHQSDEHMLHPGGCFSFQNYIWLVKYFKEYSTGTSLFNLKKIPFLLITYICCLSLKKKKKRMYNTILTWILLCQHHNYTTRNNFKLRPPI